VSEEAVTTAQSQNGVDVAREALAAAAGASAGNSALQGRQVPAGTVLFEEGAPGSEMYVIRSGKVRLTRRIEERETELAVLGTGEFFGELALLNNRPRMATATVLEQAELIPLDAKTLEGMVRSNVEISVRMLKKLAERMDRMSRQIESLLHRDLNHRVVLFLCREAERTGQPPPEGTLIPTTEAHLADQLGLSAAEVRQVVNRLELSRLVSCDDAGRFVLAENGKLLGFLDFLDMKERFWRNGYRRK